MNVQFIEASNGGNYGKFMVAQFTDEEALTTSALPELEGEPLWTAGGQRTFQPGMTLVVDLQTGEGAAFGMRFPYGLSPAEEASFQLNDKHQIWVCPLYEPFLRWLYEQDTSDITKLPRYVELDVRGALYGYRRQRGS